MPEAEILSGETLKRRRDLEQAGQKLFRRFGVPVLLKGGHLQDRAVDILFDAQGMEIFESDLVKGVNNHGSGCTLASAVAAALARGQSLRKAVKTAKEYIKTALNDALQLSPGLRVINHFPRVSQ